MSIKAIYSLSTMMVNLPRLMGSCPNFLRPTYSYTECQLSFLTGSLPHGVNHCRLQLLFVNSFLLTWHPDILMVLIWSADAIPPSALGWSFCLLKCFCHLSVIGFLSRTLPGSCSIFQKPGKALEYIVDNPAYYNSDYYATTDCCSVGNMMSFSIFSGLYLIPFFRMA